MESLDLVEDTSTVVELRQYTLQPGQRDTLIELFEREFIESQEATGMHILGQFRDARDPNRLVWLRGFADMSARAGALQAFYGGPVWKTHREAANATMVDSNDVLLLRPVDAQSGFKIPKERAPVGASRRATALVVATIYQLVAPVDHELLNFVDRSVTPLMIETGAPPIARFQTEYAPNNFPALPVREGEHAYVWFASFADAQDFEDHLARLSASKVWTEDVEPRLMQRLKVPVQRLQLEPTARSLAGNARRQ